MFTASTLKRKRALALATDRHSTEPMTQQFRLSGGLDGILSRELLRMPTGFRTLKVIAGRAYVTQGRQDHIVYSGSELVFDGDSSEALVSNLGVNTLEFEVVR